MRSHVKPGLREDWLKGTAERKRRKYRADAQIGYTSEIATRRSMPDIADLTKFAPSLDSRSLSRLRR